MSNEETLPGFQFRLLYPPLRDCLADENEAHTEIALTACRALTYLMEALPRSAAQIVEATPIFLSKVRQALRSLTGDYFCNFPLSFAASRPLTSPNKR